MRSFEAFVANRYLRTRKKGAFVRVMVGFARWGIALGVFAMVVALALMNGFREDIQANLFSATAHFTVANLSGEIPDTEAALRIIRAAPGVVAASPVRLEHGLLKTAASDAPPAPLMLKAVDPASAHGTSSIFDSLKPITVEQLKEGDILIGQELARNLGIHVGDQVGVVFLRMDLGLSGLQPKMAGFRVAGTFYSHIGEYDKSWAFIHINDAMRLAGTDQAETHRSPGQERGRHRPGETGRAGGPERQRPRSLLRPGPAGHQPGPVRGPAGGEVDLRGRSWR